MRIHLVGGFLGSGKTTAISNATKLLQSNNIIPGVITNDQGKYLVDSRFISLAHVANAEVTGGCFCCNYNQLDEKIDTLIKEAKTEVIFGESVGSCTDLLATVVKPLMEYRKSESTIVTFSGFVDSQLLLWYLQGIRLPFNEETNYIWLKQIEESEILIVNKFDVLSIEERATLKELATEKYRNKKLLFQNSLDEQSISEWVAVLQDFTPPVVRKTIDVDYDIYGAGEANLAWLDESIQFLSSSNKGVKAAISFIEFVLDDIEHQNLTIGHLKFFLSTSIESAKISLTTVVDDDWKSKISMTESYSAHMMVNARIQTTPEKIRAIMQKGIERVKNAYDLDIIESEISFFQPGYPNPTHRIVN